MASAPVDSILDVTVGRRELSDLGVDSMVVEMSIELVAAGDIGTP